MNGPRRRWRRLAATSAALVLLGCGVNSQSQPVPLPVQQTPATSPAPTQRNGYSVTVYFVQFGRLSPVSRPAPDTSPQTALQLLVEGPDAVEAATGLETALVPQRLSNVVAGRGPLNVEVGPEFTSIAGDNQLLAVAQLVWTVTGPAPTALVRITIEGKPIEVPTDDGLSRLPVGRDDYRDVAPTDPSPTPPATPPTPTASPS